MANLQFLVLAGLLLWLLWRTRVVAQTSPWLRDALLRRMFGQLNDILSVVTQVPSSLIDREEEEENWWRAEIRLNAGKDWWERRRCGPWCHADWNTPGISRLNEIEHKRTHPHQESEELKKEDFERTKRLAEGNGWLDSQYKVGRFFELGWGVAQDWNEALKWYRKAAEQGDRNARNRLASAYFSGDGVPVDYETAYFWLKLNQMDCGVDAVGDLLNKEQRAEVDRRCRDWIQSHNQGKTKNLDTGFGN
jgi:hypothetical protein